MRIKFYHSAPNQLRKGVFLADAGGKVLYVFDGSEFVKNLPRVTICSILDGNTLSFGYATCSSKDQYIKKRGQTIAKARAILKPYKTITIESNTNIKDVSAKMVDEIFDLETKRIYK